MSIISPDGSPRERRTFARSEPSQAVEGISEQRNNEGAAHRPDYEKIVGILAGVTDAFIGLDWDWRFVYLNMQAERLLGKSSEDLLGKSILEEFPEAARTPLYKESERSLYNGKSVAFEELYPPLGWFEVSAYPSESGVAICFRTVDERKRMEGDLLESEKRLKAVLVQYSSDVITILGADGTVRYESPAIERVLGYGPDELVGENAFEYIHPDDRGAAHAVFAEVLKTTGLVERPIEFRFRHKDGSWRFLEALGSNLLSDPDVGGVVINHRDVTERKALERRLEFQALHDSLTGLPNRALFSDRLEGATERAARRKSRVAVIFLDLNGFKLVNDSLGHESGDRLLAMVAERLQGAVRASDTVARMGGDEFAVLCEEAGEAEVMGVADRITAGFSAPFTIDGREVPASASLGIAFGSSGRQKPEDLMHNADAAMYRAKKRKVRHEIFDPAKDARTEMLRAERLEQEAQLRRAIEREEFTLFYQPKFRVGEDRIVEVEALLRWRHPERGLVSPTEFIPVAEESGLIIPLGRWVLGEACRQLREWRERYPAQPPTTACVNLSARQVRHPGLLQDVAWALRESGLEANGLTLEITESELIEDTETNEVVLRELRALGVHFAIDDFGKGYSSLSYVKRLPVDYLKMDRSFVKDLGENLESTSLVEVIVTLAHTFGMEAVAEGVETAEQLSYLEEMGCDIVQGYHLARPGPSDEIERLLAERQGDGRVG